MKKPHRSRIVIGVVAVLAAFVFSLAAPLRAQEEAPGEYEIKAAFLYNFTKFVEWPPDAFPGDGAPLVIGVLGPDPFGPALDEIVKGKHVSGRPLVIRRLAGSSGLDACHLLFVSSERAQEFEGQVPSIAHRPILTVGETARFADSGGIIQFVIRQRKVRFRINMAATEKARLKISSRLLDLAEVVGKSP